MNATVNDEAALTFFGELGFEFLETGGGCTAFYYRMDDDKHYLLVTAADDSRHPYDDDKRVRIGLYDEDGEVDSRIGETWDEARAAAIAMIADGGHAACVAPMDAVGSLDRAEAAIAKAKGEAK